MHDNQRGVRERAATANSNVDTLVMRRADTVTIAGRNSTLSSFGELTPPSKPRRSREGLPLDAQDLARIKSDLTPARNGLRERGHLDPLATLDYLRSAVANARRLLRHEELGSLALAWSVTQKAYRSLFGTQGFSKQPTRAAIEGVIDTSLSALRKHHQGELRPLVDTVRTQYSGRTFIPDNDTPELLKLAAVPVSKVGRVISMKTLAAGVSAALDRLPASISHVTKDIGPERIKIARLNERQEIECLELSFLRPGKVDIILNGQMVGNLWNDDALKAAEMFAKGRGFTIRPRKQEVFIVT